MILVTCLLLAVGLGCGIYIRVTNDDQGSQVFGFLGGLIFGVLCLLFMATQGFDYEYGRAAYRSLAKLEPCANQSISKKKCRELVELGVDLDGTRAMMNWPFE